LKTNSAKHINNKQRKINNSQPLKSNHIIKILFVLAGRFENHL